MTVYPTWAAGTRLTAEKMTAGQTVLIQKTADETVTSSTTLQNDDELFFTVAANGVYVADLYLFAYQGAAASTAIDINGDWSIPSGTIGWKWCFGPTVGMTDRENTAGVFALHGLATDRAYGLDSSSRGIAAHEHLMFTVGSTAGTVQYRWAQNTSNANGTTVGALSHLIVQRLA